MEATNALMRHERTGMILCTGAQPSQAVIHGQAYFGGGPGNVPVSRIRLPIERHRQIRPAVPDHGTVCSSEQASWPRADCATNPEPAEGAKGPSRRKPSRSAGGR